jgi:hypothetical protein
MHQNLGFFATWLPGDPIEIGDVGVLVDGRFRRMSSLNELGIVYAEGGAGSAQNVQYTSTNGTKVGAVTSASAANFAKATIEIDFSADGAFIFHATGLRARRLQDLASVSSGILTCYDQGRWRKDWLLVETCHEAACATIIVSQDNSANLVLSAKADGLVSAISLADPKMNLEVSSSRGKLVHIVGGRALTPLYSCMRIQHRFFGEPTTAPVRGTASRGIPFERAEIRELLDA